MHHHKGCGRLPPPTLSPGPSVLGTVNSPLYIYGCKVVGVIFFMPLIPSHQLAVAEIHGFNPFTFIPYNEKSEQVEAVKKES